MRYDRIKTSVHSTRHPAIGRYNHSINRHYLIRGDRQMGILDNNTTSPPTHTHSHSLSQVRRGIRGRRRHCRIACVGNPSSPNHHHVKLASLCTMATHTTTAQNHQFACGAQGRCRCRTNLTGLPCLRLKDGRCDLRWPGGRRRKKQEYALATTWSLTDVTLPS